VRAVVDDNWEAVMGESIQWESKKSTLSKWPSMTLDQEGTFKYVLIEATAYMEGHEEESKLLVRGHAWAEYHADMYDKEEEKLREAGLDGQCLGGGRIKRTSDNKIVVYGYSMGFGRADHSKTVDVIRKHLPDADITWNNEGY